MLVNNTAARGNSTLGFIKQNVLTTSENVKATAYKQPVCPVLSRTPLELGILFLILLLNVLKPHNKGLPDLFVASAKD